MSPRVKRPDPGAPSLAAAHPSGRGALRRVLADPAGFATIVELVPWAGELSDAKGGSQLKAAQELAGDPRITALSITDNAGGHARLTPGTPGRGRSWRWGTTRSSTSPAATGTGAGCRAWAGSCSAAA